MSIVTVNRLSCSNSAQLVSYIWNLGTKLNIVHFCIIFRREKILHLKGT